MNYEANRKTCGKSISNLVRIVHTRTYYIILLYIIIIIIMKHIVTCINIVRNL